MGDKSIPAEISIIKYTKNNTKHIILIVIQKEN